MAKKCFFIGHRDVPERVLPLLADTVEQHIREYGVTDFLVGRYGNFDRLAARAVTLAKERYPNVRLIILLPYHPADQPLAIPDGADETLYPDGLENVPKRFAIVRANRLAVEQSDFVIACVWNSTGNSRKILQHAQARQKSGLLQKVTLLPPPET